MENGEWRMENGEWRMENGELLSVHIFLVSLVSLVRGEVKFLVGFL